MGMTSMKLTAKEKKKRSELCCVDDGQDYPWGLKLDLGPEEGKKLPGLKKAAVGGTVMIKAQAKVVSISEDKGGRRMVLQIEEMDVSLSEDEEFEKGFNEG